MCAFGCCMHCSHLLVVSLTVTDKMMVNIVISLFDISSTLKTISKTIGGDHRDNGEAIGKRFSERCYYPFKMIVLMKENVFHGFKPI